MWTDVDALPATICAASAVAWSIGIAKPRLTGVLEGERGRRGGVDADHLAVDASTIGPPESPG